MSTAATVVSIFNTSWLVIKWGWPFFLLIAMFIARNRWKAYPIDAVIIEYRGENLVKTRDRAGLKFDKETNFSRYQLAKSKETMPVPDYDYVMHNADKPTNFLEKLVDILRPTQGTIFLFKYGSKQYKPLNINRKKGEKLQLKEHKDPQNRTLYHYQWAQWDPRWVLNALDFEVVDWDNINFLVQEQTNTLERRKKKGEFWKSLAIPAMAIAGTVVLCIVMMKFSVDFGAEVRGEAQAQASRLGDSSVLGGIDNALTPGA